MKQLEPKHCWLFCEKRFEFSEVGGHLKTPLKVYYLPETSKMIVSFNLVTFKDFASVGIMSTKVNVNPACCVFLT